MPHSDPPPGGARLREPEDEAADEPLEEARQYSAVSGLARAGTMVRWMIRDDAGPHAAPRRLRDRGWSSGGAAPRPTHRARQAAALRGGGDSAAGARAEARRSYMSRGVRSGGVAVMPAPRRGGRAMLKHRGFPGRLPGSDLQFTIRRADAQGRDAAEGARALCRPAAARPGGGQGVPRRALGAFRRGALRARQPRRRPARLAAAARGACRSEDPFDPASYEATAAGRPRAGAEELSRDLRR